MVDQTPLWIFLFWFDARLPDNIKLLLKAVKEARLVSLHSDNLLVARYILFLDSVRKKGLKFESCHCIGLDVTARLHGRSKVLRLQVSHNTMLLAKVENLPLRLNSLRPQRGHVMLQLILARLEQLVISVELEVDMRQLGHLVGKLDDLALLCLHFVLHTYH